MNKVLTVLNIIGLIAIVLFILQPFRTEPPTPHVTAGEVVIPVTEGSYCWDGLFSVECVEKEYMSADTAAPIIVSPGEVMKVKFDMEPDTVLLETRMDDGSVEKVKLKDHAIYAPAHKGIYVYHLMVYWGKGDGSYMFKVEVK
ncbi:hypothetical protein [Bacillus sp. KH172YL63]|uniref:hypothetical protein n=1 Tax=Bacillus sp. KH172YL63 TaxID=2709784 RepID=UPI0013E4A1F4|nr:hypothetical protein [Bacillus sp. KH172YL63]BCB04225.1 hypothetical protein KH172YL63_23580 [Bacillus sp. KH172YL63]